MPTTEHVAIALTPAESAALQQAIDSGAYSSKEEILEEALHEWQGMHSFHPEQIAQLREAWQTGKNSGPARPVDMNQVLLKARARLQAHKDASNAA